MQAPVLRNIQQGYDFFKNWWIQLDGASKYKTIMLIY